ncbi:MAG: tyrosine-type recombinase/integrase [Desulfovibrio sp.]|jgi:integrase|nr:tyrosine-type recombinase/integrase [Desulfovibrio sp.]
MAISFLAYKGKPWLVQYREPWSGRPRRRSFATEGDAVAFEAATRDLYERERTIVRAVKRRRTAQAASSLTVSEICDRYIDTLANPGTRSASTYHLALFRSIYGHRKARGITLDDAAAFLSLQRGRGVCQSTACRRLGIVRTAYNWAARWGLLSSNPLAALRLSTQQPQTPAPPSLHEARLLYAAAAPHVQRVIVIGMAAGPRIGPSELFRLRWSDVDTRAGMIRMPQASKGARDASRDVPVRKDVLGRLREWEAEDASAGYPFVIHYKGKPVRRIGRAWHNARIRAGITRRLRPYDLRHAFATRLLDHDADIKAVSECMGHADEKMILRYYRHTSARQRRKAVNVGPSLGLT